MKLKMITPDDIMTIIVALIIFGVGIYAFFVTIQNIPVISPANTSTAFQNATYYAVINASKTGNSVFNIVGVVMIVGAIMIIVGVVYSYVRRPGAPGP
jgi:hypothetical protein